MPHGMAGRRLSVRLVATGRGGPEGLSIEVMLSACCALGGGVRMAELIHVSKVKIVKDKGPVRRAYIENFPEPVRFGVHGGIKEFYGVEPEEELPTTLDHVIAGVAG
jgi:hypothetical protein